jgi:hypothetical protein
MQKLSQEEKEDILDILSSEGVKALLRLIQLESESISQEVLKYDLGSGDERELVRRKCRAEGAAKLERAVLATLSSLKAKQKA